MISLKSAWRKNSLNMTKRFTAIIIIFNIIMGLLLYLSSQLVLLVLRGFIVEGVNIFSIYTGLIQPAGFNPPIPTSRLPLPNFPFYVFMFSLIVNIYFIIKLQRSKETKQNPS
jgi:hypothetical protein